MSILVVGGDKLGSITHKLSENGFSDIQHISGRKYGDRKLKISCKTDLVLVLIDFVDHAMMNIIKKESKKYGIKITFSKRSWIHMESNIKNSIKEISVS
ncbi:hypothetical protein JOC70_002222 [Clostridium pascui]|uniref:DUF2325 domain-containing protein n=1 Tax=Clostridium pascui TaxID=46609 RepID=UPI001957F641|nr:DUF2325 domain-containing protein [Clostridium pascui]MBM7870728.1 hypothetical protein [Clostridium pascui]